MQGTIPHEKDFKDDARFFSLNGKDVYAKVVDVYDGDKITCIFPLPVYDADQEKHYKWKCKLSIIDTFEINEKEKACNYLRNEILGKVVWLNCHDFDNYGNVLVTLWKIESKHMIINMNRMLIQNGYTRIKNK